MEQTRTITATELRQMLEQGDPVAVVDVRPLNERGEWFIPDSIHVDAYDALRAGDMSSLAAIELPPRDTPVVTVCGAGHTSKIAAQEFKRRGHTAFSLEGGMRAWSLAWNTAEVHLARSPTRIVQVRRTGKGCLSYLIIGPEGEAAVVDPALEPDIFLSLAERHGCSISSVLDTHIHADHLSCSRQLAQQSGAMLWLPTQNRARFPFSALGDGDVLDVGGTTLEAIHTPGHTPESTCYRVGEALLTGDTLFLSSVGRPDLETDAAGARSRAQALYRSLQHLRRLSAATIALPGHTSEPIPFDGRPITATLGEIVPRLGILHLSETEFVETILSRIPPTPPNHHRIVELNEAGLLPELDPTELEAGTNRCAVS